MKANHAQKSALSAEFMLQMLRTECAAAGGQKPWAAKHRVSPQYVSDVLLGRREAGRSILDALGLEKVVTYARKP